MSRLVRVISMRTLDTQPMRTGEWHRHSYHELCLLADDASTIGKSRSEHRLEPDTLLYFAPGEMHGYWNSRTESPRFWILHFTVPDRTARPFTFLNQRGKQKGVWKLSPARSLAFRAQFWKIFWEHEQRREFHEDAESALLWLLMMEVERWRREPNEPTPASLMPGPEVLRLWQVINDFEGPPQKLASRLAREFPNYDSLRHAFKQAFGCSPRAQLLRMRLKQAENLLRDATLSVGDVARRLGFEYQHDFSRSFRQQTGMSPTAWRRRNGG